MEALENQTSFVTFYSFKGGVGRTSALVNTAVQLARDGNRVVVVDFDFEAPGLHSYLQRICEECGKEKEGIVEYLYDAIFQNSIPSLKDRSYELSDKIKNKNGGSLWFIGAGKFRSVKYSKAVESLKWSEIFEKHQGELLLRNLKNQINREFERPDYVFIDSRTGITETGGVCTRYLADMVVMLTSLNEQNIDGTAGIHKDLKKDNKKFLLVASNVPVGLPSGTGQLLESRIQAFKDAFGGKPDLFIYHYPALSLEEKIAVLPEDTFEIDRNDPLVNSYDTLSEKIDEQNLNSFTQVLDRAWPDFWTLVSDSTKDMEKSEAVSELKGKFSDRLLSKIFFELVKFARDSNSTNFSDEWIDGFFALKQRIKATDNEDIEMMEAMMDRRAQRSAREFIKKNGMRAKMEIFFQLNELIDLALIEIGRKNFDWPIDFLKRRLEFSKTKKPGSLDIPWYAFNLASALKFKGDTSDTAVYYEDVYKSKDAILQKVHGNEKETINRKVCLGIAALELGKSGEAHSFFRSAITDLKAREKGLTVFSPLVFKEVTASELIEQLSSMVESTQ